MWAGKFTDFAENGAGRLKNGGIKPSPERPLKKIIDKKRKAAGTYLKNV